MEVPQQDTTYENGSSHNPSLVLFSARAPTIVVPDQDNFGKDGMAHVRPPIVGDYMSI